MKHSVVQHSIYILTLLICVMYAKNEQNKDNVRFSSFNEEILYIW